MRQEKEIECIQTGKVEVILPVYSDIILFIENARDSTEKTIRTNKFNKVGEHKLMYENHFCFYTQTMNYSKRKESNTIQNNIKKKKILKNEHKQGIKDLYAENHLDERN